MRNSISLIDENQRSPNKQNAKEIDIQWRTELSPVLVVVPVHTKLDPKSAY